MTELTAIYWGGAHCRGKVNQLGVNATMISDATPDNSSLKHGYRWHADEDGTPWVYTFNTGNPTLEQERFDYLAQQFIDGGGTGLDFLFYPIGDYMALGVAGEQVSADIWRAGFELYMASALKSQLKFTLILSNSKLSHDGTIAAPSNTWGNYTTFVNYFVTLFQDAQYLKVETNRPLVYVYHVPTFPDFDATKREELDDACVLAGLGLPFYVQVQHSATDTLCEALSAYGVVAGARPAGSGQKPWTAQRLKDKSNWGPHTSFKTIVSLTPCCNGEPRGVSVYSDRPMFSEMVSHLQEALAFIDANPTKVTNPPVIQMYSITEPDEGGPLARSPQDLEGVSPYLAATAAVMNDDIPEQYWNTYTGRSLHVDVTRSGFTTYQHSIVGAYEYAESQSAVAGHTLTVAPTQPISAFQFRGSRSTGRGIAEFYVDGVLAATVDLYQVATERNAVLYEQSGLTPAVRTIQCRVTGTKHASASAATIGIDSIRTFVDLTTFTEPEAGMGTLSTDLINDGIDHVLGVAAYTPPATIDVHLYLGGGVEVSAGDYAPLEVDNDGTTWDATAGRVKTNAINLDWPDAAVADWGEIAEVRGFNPDTAAEMFRHTLVTPQTISAGQTARIAAGVLTITAAAGSLSDDTVHSWLDLAFGGTAYTAETDLEFAYYDGDPQGAGVEITGTGYTRDVLTNDGTTWSAAASGVARNLIDVSVGTAGAGDWDEATHWALFNAAGTDVVMSAALPVARTVANGETETIATGRIRPTWT